jgi:hypothetical protein
LDDYGVERHWHNQPAVDCLLFGITFQLELNVYGVECYIVQCHHSTWMIMMMNVIGITKQPLTVFGVAIQLELDGYQCCK